MSPSHTNIYLESKQFTTNYLNRLKEVLSKIDSDEISHFVELIENTRQNNGKLMFIGNGGSASTASHFATDLGFGIRWLQNPIKALSLTDNTGVITAMGNDISFNDVFERQVNNYACSGDVLVAISASGNSENLLRAVNAAVKNEVTTVGITAFDGGQLKKDVNHSIHIPTELGEYGFAEDAHLVVNHIITNYFMMLLRNDFIS
jgi:D-sedoheptulose 7-phosphate isomerase